MSSGNNNSGAWEVVGKPTSKKSSSKSNGKKHNKGSGVAGVKLEDVLPLNQLNTWYANAYDTPSSESEEDAQKKSKASNNNNTKGGKKKAETKKEAVPAQTKKVASTLEEAAASNLLAANIKARLGESRVLYPGNKELWVRDIASYLNVALTTTEKTPKFVSDLFSDKPAGALTREMRRALSSTLEECSISERQSIFDSFLVAVARNMSKGVTGNLIILQLLAEAFPVLCVNNIPKFAELRNSYSNRPHICESLLWAVGQGGRHDLKVGLRVWMEIMLPLVTNRNYHRFIIDYLSTLLKHHPKSNRRVIFPTQFLQFLEAFFVQAPTRLNKKNYDEFLNLYPTIKDLSVGDGSGDHELFCLLLRRISVPSQTNEAEMEEALSILQRCLINSHEASLAQWHQMYSSYIYPSELLLSHLGKNWSTLPQRVRSSKAFANTVKVFQEYNKANPSKDFVAESYESCRVLLSKMSGKSKGWFPWKTACLFLFALISFMVKGDYEKHKSFKVSNTGMFLSDVGIYDPIMYSLDTSRNAFNNGVVWAEKKAPGVLQTAKEMSVFVATKTVEVGNHASLYAQKVVASTRKMIDANAPTLKKKVKYFYDEAYTMADYAQRRGVKGISAAYKDFISMVSMGWKSSKQCANDIFDGKIDLADVKNYLQKKISAFVVSLKKFIDYVLERANKYLYSK